MENLIGKTVMKDFIIEEHIGSGGFGDVYKASKQLGHKKLYSAIKRIVIPKEEREYEELLRSKRNDKKATDEYFRARYDDVLQEVALMHELRGKSQNIISYGHYELNMLNESDPKKYEILIEMEYLTSLDRYSLMKDMTVRDVLQLGIDVASGLEVCHAQKIMHRDIKTANIFISENGTFKLGDFGLAKKLVDASRARSNVGTKSYMAPEIAGLKTREYGKTVDIYSLGLVLYEALNHWRMPFYPSFPTICDDEQIDEAMFRRMSGETISPPQNGPRELTDVVLKACAPDPERRYQTASELKLSLQLVMSALGVEELDKVISHVDTRKDLKETIVDTASMGAGISIGKPISPDDRFVHVDLTDSYDGRNTSPERAAEGNAEKERNDRYLEEKDFQLWEITKKQDSVSALKGYIDGDTPGKKHVDDAWAEIDRIIERNKYPTSDLVIGTTPIAPEGKDERIIPIPDDFRATQNDSKTAKNSNGRLMFLIQKPWVMVAGLAAISIIVFLVWFSISYGSSRQTKLAANLAASTIQIENSTVPSETTGQNIETSTADNATTDKAVADKVATDQAAADKAAADKAVADKAAADKAAAEQASMANTTTDKVIIDSTEVKINIEDLLYKNDFVNGTLNTQTRGEVTSDGTRIFFSKRSGGLYSMLIDGSSSFQIADDPYPASIMAIGEWVFYTSPAWDGNSSERCVLNKVKKDGSEKQIVKDFGFTYATNFIYSANSSLYYIKYQNHDVETNGYNQPALFKMMISGENEVKISDFEPWSLSINEDWGYCTLADSKLNRVSLQNGTKQKISDGADLVNPNILKGFLYYVRGNTLHRMKVDGTSVEDLGMSVSYYNSIGSMMLYINPVDQRIHKNDLITDFDEVIGPSLASGESYGYRLLISGGWFFFQIHKTSDNHETIRYFMMQINGSNIVEYASETY